MGAFMMMGLIGIILAGLVNIFLQSSALQFAITVIGVVVFVGLTAYDTQRIKADYLEHAYSEGTDEAGKRSVFDALGLYLNFVNLFQLLLQLMGVRQNSE
jgi:FtsH-binding integral membrane protein